MKTSLHSVASDAATVALVVSMSRADAQGSRVADAVHTPHPTPVIVIVRVPKPWYAPKSIVIGKMREAIPEYSKLPGLLYKAFSIERGSSDFGGIYFWRDRASAEAWFNSAWFEHVRKKRHAEPMVRIFEAPASIDNTRGGTPADSQSKSVATLVQIPIPQGTSAERIVDQFKAAVPTDQGVPGLLREHLILTSNGIIAGVYLWKDEASAKAWFNEAWHSRIVGIYNHDAKIEWFDTPILLPTADSANRVAAQALTGVAP